MNPLDSPSSSCSPPLSPNRPKPGADFELQEREIPQIPAGHVRIRIQACGIGFCEQLVKDGLFPGISYPRSPDHEIAGVVDEVGPRVTTWKKGQRVGVGWHGGHDGTCLQRRRGDFIHCANEKTTGISAELTGVRPMIEKFPLAKVNQAHARMTSGKAQFRVVLTM